MAMRANGRQGLEALCVRFGVKSMSVCIGTRFYRHGITIYILDWDQSLLTIIYKHYGLIDMA